MTVASMPIWSPATRLPPLAAMAMPRKMLPPPMTTPILTPRRDGRADLAREAADDRVVDAEGLVAEQGLAGELEQHALVADSRRHPLARRHRRLHRTRRPDHDEAGSGCEHSVTRLIGSTLGLLLDCGSRRRAPRRRSPSLAFSTPSPSRKTTNSVTLIGAADSASAAASPSRRSSRSRPRSSARGGRPPRRTSRIRPSTILSMIASGLPDSLACSAKIARSRATTAGSTPPRGRRAGCAAATCMATCRPSASSLSWSPGDSRPTMTPILPRPGATALWT